MLLYFPRQNQQMNPAMGMNAAQMMVAAQQNLAQQQQQAATAGPAMGMNAGQMMVAAQQNLAQQQQAATAGPASASTGSDNSSMIPQFLQVTYCLFNFELFSIVICAAGELFIEF